MLVFLYCWSGRNANTHALTLYNRKIMPVEEVRHKKAYYMCVCTYNMYVY